MSSSDDDDIRSFFLHKCHTTDSCRYSSRLVGWTGGCQSNTAIFLGLSDRINEGQGLISSVGRDHRLGPQGHPQNLPQWHSTSPSQTGTTFTYISRTSTTVQTMWSITRRFVHKSWVSVNYSHAVLDHVYQVPTTHRFTHTHTRAVRSWKYVISTYC